MTDAERVLLEQLEQKIRLWRREYGAFGSLSGQSLNEMDESAIGLAALLRALPQTVEPQEACPDCNGTGTRMYAREVSDGCDRCNATGKVAPAPSGDAQKDWIEQRLRQAPSTPAVIAEMRAYVSTMPESSACRRISQWADRLAVLLPPKG